MTTKDKLFVDRKVFCFHCIISYLTSPPTLQLHPIGTDIQGNQNRSIRRRYMPHNPPIPTLQLTGLDMLDKYHDCSWIRRRLRCPNGVYFTHCGLLRFRLLVINKYLPCHRVEWHIHVDRITGYIYIHRTRWIANLVSSPSKVVGSIPAFFTCFACLRSPLGSGWWGRQQAGLRPSEGQSATTQQPPQSSSSLIIAYYKMYLIIIIYIELCRLHIYI